MRTLWSRVGELLLRRSREGRLSEEVQQHLDLLTDDFVSQGMSIDEARLAARREFGNVDALRISHRRQRGLPVLESLTQDVRFAWRVLKRDRGFALTAIFVLGVGLGVNNMFFTLVYAHKFRGVPIHQPGRVLSVSTLDDRGNAGGLSLPEYTEFRDAQTSFGAVGAYVITVATVGDPDRAADRFNATYFTSGTFELLGVTPMLGRLPSKAEDGRGSAAVALLSADAWQLRYGNDPAILGRVIQVNGAPATVIGIVRERSGFPSTAKVWLPLGQWPEWKDDRASRSLLVIGRLRDGVSVEAARQETEAMFGRFESAYPEANRNRRARVTTLNDRLLGSLQGWWQFIFAGTIVILVACANLANLMFARALNRAPELAIRTSLGASRKRVVVQLLAEAVLIAAAGTMVGGVFSVAGARAIEAGIPDGILPYWTSYRMDLEVFAMLAGAALITVVAFGLVPALHASRTDVNRTLKLAGRTSIAPFGTRVWTGGFLTMQLALAVILLAQVAVASYLANQTIPTDAAINTTEIVTAAITLPAATYASPAQRREFFARLEQRLRARAEVGALSRGTVLPGEGGPPRKLQVRGQDRPTGENTPTVLVVDASPGYFDTLLIGLLRGRDFTPLDNTGGPRAAIVNERFAQVFFNGADAIGSQIAVSPANQPLPDRPQWLTVVGLAPTIRQSTGVAESPVVYLPIDPLPPVTSSLMVRHRVDPESAAALVRSEAHAIDPNVPLYRMRTLEQAVRDAQWNRHTAAVLADTVTLLSVLLAIVGLYAVTAQRVTLRTREIGLRMALGARPAQVAGSVMRGLRWPLVLGLLLGTAGSMGWDGAYSSGAEGIYASAPPTLLKIAVCLTLFVMAACAAPIRRATRLDPIAALRDE
jgi:predicted permease